MVIMAASPRDDFVVSSISVINVDCWPFDLALHASRGKMMAVEKVPLRLSLVPAWRLGVLMKCSRHLGFDLQTSGAFISLRLTLRRV
ncbi:hypothetical protein SCLCIDRAFT_1139174 [Scleroderma citrinum Foug A]|uniref:Uncharacterized protein n=1 Tax=Scleroderma citrinum Foug A TaxID=1036808 RepID=A0A0C3DMP0_9AGAM|nr:hypothetical protein SCLCIDRAFT_1139174 [Scleroderma citrinum Foug A]